jgi:hypothetical protein
MCELLMMIATGMSIPWHSPKEWETWQSNITVESRFLVRVMWLI